MLNELGPSYGFRNEKDGGKIVPGKGGWVNNTNGIRSNVNAPSIVISGNGRFLAAADK